MSRSQTLIVGDIQGCYGGLMKLLEKAHFDDKRDTLFAVGDLIARGEDSLATVQFLMKLGDRFSTVLGNHDLHFLAVTQGLKKAKKNDRLTPLLNHRHLPEIIHWFRQFPLALQATKHHTLIHAGLYPSWSTDKLLALSTEISDKLKGPDWVTLLKNMYGDGPDNWHDDLSDIPRERFIINACTRMRFLRNNQQLEFASKSHPSEASKELHPWFTVSNPFLDPQQRIVFGHWAALEGETGSSQFIGLDTGYVWGNTLTALHVESNSYLCVSA
ncbi:symmetrical bis(5'-nucleosyl)-tetraphosphatase [Alteromonas sp. C1M14]|uniref:symmetrical bis(5'-nucleosyl)-tetraphosphatase n=1 Tax=Alteromonas sp. C1M14 TaxID=2841567 RepID=UPI001C08923B|nr:symmetrical bis(5'-nucleosyl)-tetraphosphatase [Alteromonas sp. C1M14]MBU2977652.1 symmetrical bis(5'-nucleosyl)-tetraphosphatase [Alteromonas sp. C1M14]